jgi:hypothetical protein
MDVEYYWHMYHDQLVTPVMGPIKDRRKYIRTEKAKYEPPWKIKLRLRLLKRVRGTVLLDRAAKAAYDARIDLDTIKTGKKLQAMLHVLAAAWASHETELRNFKANIEALHAEECPDCPWDGETIFPEGGGE